MPALLTCLNSLTRDQQHIRTISSIFAGSECLTRCKARRRRDEIRTESGNSQIFVRRARVPPQDLRAPIDIDARLDAGSAALLIAPRFTSYSHIRLVQKRTCLRGTCSQRLGLQLRLSACWPAPHTMQATQSRQTTAFGRCGYAACGQRCRVSTSTSSCVAAQRPQAVPQRGHRATARAVPAAVALHPVLQLAAEAGEVQAPTWIIFVGCALALLLHSDEAHDAR